MEILIVFATTEGQTRKIARFAAQSMQRDGHTVELIDCSKPHVDLDPAKFDAVILAASVHNQRYQPAIYDFVSSHRDALLSKPLAFVSVSLAITLASGEEEARGYVDNFLTETELSLDQVHLAEGAVRYFEYSGSEASTIHLNVFKGQKKMPPRQSNPEYTDWSALEDFVKSFLQSARQTVVAAAPINPKE